MHNTNQVSLSAYLSVIHKGQNRTHFQRTNFIVKNIIMRAQK